MHAKPYDLYDALLAGLRANPWKNTVWLTRLPKKKPVKKPRRVSNRKMS